MKLHPSKKLGFFLVAAGATTALLLNCTSQPPKQDGKPSQEAQLKQQMMGMAQSFSDLLPYISNKQAFHDSKNFSRIESKTLELSKLAHNINKDIISADEDPGIQFAAENFDEEINRAYNGLKLGHREYARNILSTVSGYCIRCHTKDSQGNDFAALSLSADSEAMSKMARAELYAATRQFDRALEAFGDIMSDNEMAKQVPFQWERAARFSMAISVRYKNNPQEARKTVENLIKHPHAPEFLKQDARKWLDHIIAWSKEKKSANLSSQAKYEQVKKLINQAQQSQEYPTDRTGDVLYLRASGLLHELLREGQQNPHFNEMLLLAGTCYEALRDLGYWTLHEFYYQACIEKTPHSRLAQKCYNRYEQSVYAGYSGSAGLSLPPDIREKLGKLKTLAF